MNKIFKILRQFITEIGLGLVDEDAMNDIKKTAGRAGYKAGKISAYESAKNKLDELVMNNKFTLSDYNDFLNDSIVEVTLNE